jgi:hypothetical protein
MKEVGRETGENVAAGWNFVQAFMLPGAESAYRKIKALRLLDDGWVSAN